jgi:hypothetical protein
MTKIHTTSFFFICAFLFWKQIGNIEIIHKSKEMIISMLDLFLEKWLKVLQQFKMLLLSVREQPYGIHSEKSHRWCNHSRMNFSHKKQKCTDKKKTSLFYITSLFYLEVYQKYFPT